MNGSSVLGKDWISKNYNTETVNFLKDNFNLSEIVSKLIAIRNIKLDEVKLFFTYYLLWNINFNFYYFFRAIFF